LDQVVEYASRCSRPGPCASGSRTLLSLTSRTRCLAQMEGPQETCRRYRMFQSERGDKQHMRNAAAGFTQVDAF
jgi:hypothetical protein